MAGASYVNVLFLHISKLIWLASGYRRTVLVIWPDRFDCEIRYSGITFNSALHEMLNLDLPSAKRTQIAEYVLQNANQDRSQVARSVTKLALADKDYTLWDRGVMACEANEALAVLSGEDVVAAIRTLGLDKVKKT